MNKKTSSWSVVRTCFIELKNRLTVDQSLLEDLAEKGVLSEEEYKNIVDVNPERRTNQLLRKVLPNKDDERSFDVFLTFLREHNKAEIADRLCEQKDRSTAEDLHHAVTSQDLRELTELCRKHGIDAQKFHSIEQCRFALFEHFSSTPFSTKSLKDVTGSETADLTCFKEVQRRLDEKRLELIQLCQSVQEAKDNLRKELAELGVSRTTFWLKPGIYAEVEERIRREKPKILVAGATSAGKSTLINALLGEDILPSNYNATTSAFCKIQFSEKRSACVTLEEDAGTPRTKTLDLQSSEGIKQLAGYLNYDRANPSSYVCKHAVVNWPAEILKHLTIIDSPGVTEKSDVRLAQKIAEYFHDEHISGIVYVLNACRSAEETGNVDGLLQIIAGDIPSHSKAAVFVINKWDRLTVTVPGVAERREYKSLVQERIAVNFQFLTRDQVVTMNAKLALWLRKWGYDSDDLTSTLHVLAKLLPWGLDNMLIEVSSCIHHEVNEIVALASNVHHHLTFSECARAARLKQHMLLLDQFRESIESGKIAKLFEKTDKKLEELAVKLIAYLKSPEGYCFALHSKEVNDGINQDGDPEEVAKNRLFRMVVTYKGLNQLAYFVLTEIEPDVDFICTKLDKFEENKRRFRMPASARRPRLSHGMDFTYALRKLALTLFLHLPTGKTTITKNQTDDISEMEYRKEVEFVCQHGSERILNLLRQFTRQLPVLKKLYVDIPNRIKDLGVELCTASKVCLPETQTVITKFQSLQQRLTSFMLKLNVHCCISSDVQSESSHCRRTLVRICDQPEVYLNEVREVNQKFGCNSAKLFEEIAALRTLRNKHLLNFYGSYLMSENPLVVGLLLQFDTQWLSLAEKINNSDDNTRRLISEKGSMIAVAINVLNGLQYLHSQKVVHGRLMAKDVWILDKSKTEIKLGGYLARYNFADSFTVYDAFELRSGRKPIAASDVYSFGVLLWEIWNLQCATEAEDIRWKFLTLPVTHTKVSVEAQKVSSACRSIDDAERPTLDTVLEKMKLVKALLN